ncbi:heavy metal response regulator transcription factor [Acinetobacter pollinis]|uniref:heavy metal response regulator transcription factor n=1 Tax=Acinetobacter pollinis TaxID=2605270 RepID=UPI0018A30F9C|nr:heavy metal response regulator transcription factor [Acinetobacter pollinis]MBF7689802.1 heavy metal response regulator transcription factor [Acinetobacter pollinis]MBF7697346.1 heavy metal response regulator transcription factor [Acinetobacter pollinis]
MKILLAEDELKTGDYLTQGLTESGYITDWVKDGISAQHQALYEEYDLIILDVMLPKLDGWHVIQEIRKQGKSMPILFLTAKDQIEDRVKGLDLGADDYLIKPFAFAELLARIKSLLRRGQQQREENNICIADLELDLIKRRITRSGQRIDLTAKEFALMELFMRRQGEILPRTLIASQIWDMNFDSDTNVVEVAIKRLRSKIDNGFSPKLIQNVRGMGYVLEVNDD